MSVINQKEYLKKYLNIGNDKEKKKKKKKKAIQNRLTIIDDNIDVVNHEEFTANELDEFLTQEDAPQVVGVIDDRPLALRLDDYRKSSKWKLVGSDDEERDLKLMNDYKFKSQENVTDEDKGPPKKEEYNQDSDNSPPRKGDSDISPPRKTEPDTKNYDGGNKKNDKTRFKIEFAQKKKYFDNDSLRYRHLKTRSPVRKNKDLSPVRKYGQPSGSDSSPPRKYRKDPSPKPYKKHSDSDTSPPRRSRKESSPKRRKRSPRSRKDSSPKPSKTHSDSDTSPPRKSRKDSSPKPYKKHSDSDTSLCRKSRKDSSPKPYRKHSDSDASLPRKSRKDSSPKLYIKHPDSDSSPPRKSKRDSSPKPYKKHPDSDTSPPRKSRRDFIPTKQHVDFRGSKRSDSDASLPRKSRREPSPKQSKKPSDSDTSPSRKRDSPKRKKCLDSDSIQSKNTSPPRKQKTYDSDSSPPRKSKHDSSPSTSKRNSTKPSDRPRSTRWADVTPPRDDPKPEKNRHSDESKKEKISFKESSSSKKMTKTLDGKIAGLQNARDLKQETVAFKKREDELFRKMTEDVSGANAAPIIRDRKTGKKRDFEKEAMEQFAKLKAEQEKKDKYNRWGKGLKQVEDLKEKIASDIHEMNKPLARYADDEDLDKYLREQEREGDPMLQYIRKKKKKKDVDEGKPMKPVYQGEYMPNRFGIPPGYRWDGVDRSNGYEKQWFDKQNAKKAMEEEVYKWSTEDM